MENNNLDRVIDLTTEKEEIEWAYSAQAFFENLIPIWFSWLERLFLIGGAAFVAEKTGSKVVLAIEISSYVLILMYFNQVFASIRIEPFYSKFYNHRNKIVRWICQYAYIFGGVGVTLGSVSLIQNIVHQIVEAS